MTSLATPAVVLRGVHTHIGAYHILHGVDFVAPAGAITLLLGRNGAGKTTTLRTMMGLWPASQGTVHICGVNTQALPTPALPTPDVAALGVAYVPEGMGIFADLTVKENLLLAARQARRVQDINDARLQWIFKLFPPVQTFWNHPAGKLSGGQKQMVSVARAMVEPRRLLIVDEPSKGLAPAIVGNMIEAFAELKAQGTAIVLVEQNLGFATRLGDHVAVMDNGRVVHASTMDDFNARPDLRNSLLGLSL